MILFFPLPPTPKEKRDRRRKRLRRIARDLFYYSIWIGFPLAFCAALGYMLARIAP